MIFRATAKMEWLDHAHVPDLYPRSWAMAHKTRTFPGESSQALFLCATNFL